MGAAGSVGNGPAERTAVLRIAAGGYEAREALDPADRDRAAALRWLAFRQARGLAPGPGADRDAFDDGCRQILITERAGGAEVATFRLRAPVVAAGISRAYAAQVYDLSPLAAWPGPLAEFGRFCLHPGHRHPDIIRLAWGVLARLVEEERIGLIFGCCSFAGADPGRHAAALAWLARHHLGPARWRPGRRAAEVIALTEGRGGCEADLPPLLRSYLAMGGWVGDHAVIDRDLDTLHIFTALDVAAVPEARARALRALAGCEKYPGVLQTPGGRE